MHTTKAQVFILCHPSREPWLQMGCSTMKLYLPRSAQTGPRLEATLTWTDAKSLLCPQLGWESCRSYQENRQRCPSYTAHPQIHLPPAQEYTYPYLAVLTGTPHHQPTWLLGEYGCKKVGLRSAPSFRLRLETPSLATRTHLQVMLFYHVMSLFSFLNVTALSW